VLPNLTVDRGPADPSLVDPAASYEPPVPAQQRGWCLLQPEEATQLARLRSPDDDETEWEIMNEDRERHPDGGDRRLTDRCQHERGNLRVVGGESSRVDVDEPWLERRKRNNDGMRRDDLERGRECFRQCAWLEAHESLARVDRETRLAPQDLELFATAAYMLGRDEDQLDVLERAHRGYLHQGERLRAVRCAIWIGVHLMLRLEIARATGWFGRARRLLDQEQRDSVERGYLLSAIQLQRQTAFFWAHVVVTAVMVVLFVDRTVAGGDYMAVTIF
jgi:hypothetical protein